MPFIKAPQGKIFEVKFSKNLIDINFQLTPPLKKFLPPIKTMTNNSVKYFLVHHPPPLPFPEVLTLLPSDILPFPSKYLLSLLSVNFQDVLILFKMKYLHTTFLSKPLF